MSVTVDTSFDAGALGAIQELTADRLIAEIPRDWDQDRFNTQATWYYFRLDGLGGRPFQVVLTGLGSVYNGKESVGGIRQEDQGFHSPDALTWTKFESATFDADARTYTINLPAGHDTLYVAHLEPYTAADLAALETAIAGHPAVRREVAGQSIEGRDIPFWTIGDDAAPQSVWIIARQHAWETHTNYCLEGTIHWLLTPEAAPFLDRCVVKLLPLFDPDGVRTGVSRFNRLGWDLNRHWDETDPDNPEHRRVRPEICAGKAVLRDWLAAGHRTDFHLNLHDTQNDIYVVPNGLGTCAWLRDFYARLCAASFSGPFRETPLGPLGTCQNAIYHEFGVPAALIELGTAPLPTIGGHPTREYRRVFGADLGRALAAALPPVGG